MWPFRDPNNAIPTFTVDNTIAAGTLVRGNLTGPDGFRIDGNVEGAIEADGPVVIGEGGVIEGGVRGRDVIVLGRIRGDVRASGHLEIGPKGKVLGNICVQSFRMQSGGVFRGTSTMAGGEEAAPAPALGQGVRIAVVEGTPRTRTLPPPNGAVPPPPTLSELAVLTPLPAVREASASQERLITGAAPTPRRGTGTGA